MRQLSFIVSQCSILEIYIVHKCGGCIWGLQLPDKIQSTQWELHNEPFVMEKTNKIEDKSSSENKIVCFRGHQVITNQQRTVVF